jgi:Right handed beta helix region
MRGGDLKSNKYFVVSNNGGVVILNYTVFGFTFRQLTIFILVYTVSISALSSEGSITLDKSITLFVAIDGSDKHSGRHPVPAKIGSNGPFATIGRAQQEIRTLARQGKTRDGVTVFLGGGTYFLESTLAFHSIDSGLAKAPIVYTARPGENVTLSGGRELQNCQADGSDYQLCKELPSDLATLSPMGDRYRVGNFLPPFELFSSNLLLNLSRTPNSKEGAVGGGPWYHISLPNQGSSNNSFFSSVLKKQDITSTEGVVHIWSGNDWYDEYIGIESSQNGLITLNKPPAYPFKTGRRFAILNTFAGLDQSGEWLYGSKKKEITIRRQNGVEIKGIVLSYLDNIVDFREARHIHFRDITFSHSRHDAISIFGGESLSFSGVTIRDIGGYGFRTRGGRGHVIEKADISGTGYGGVYLSGGNRNSLTPSNHKVLDSNIHHTNRLVKAGKAAVVLDGVGNSAFGNHIHHTPGTAVAIKGNNNILSLNDIHHACEQSADCGAVYSGRNWTYHGNRIEGNIIHDIYGFGMKAVDTLEKVVTYASPYGGRGIYLDDAVSGLHVSKNLLYRIPGIAIQIGGGRHNSIDNNIILADGIAMLVDARWPGFPWETTMQSRLEEVPYRSEVWRQHFPLLSAPMEHPELPEGNSITRNIIIGPVERHRSVILPFRYDVPSHSIEIDNNIVWNPGGSVRVEYSFLPDGGREIVDWASWMKLGLDSHSRIGDPGLQNIDIMDFAFKDNSLAEELNIQALPRFKPPNYSSVGNSGGISAPPPETIVVRAPL